MDLVVIIFTFLIAQGLSGVPGVSPQTRFDFDDTTSRRPPACRPATDGELKDANISPGKASTYSMRGFYVCERKIFAADERDAMIDVFAHSAAEKGGLSAALLKQLAADAKSWRVWVIPDTSDDVDVARRVHQIFVSSLAEQLPPGKVLRDGGVALRRGQKQAEEFLSQAELPAVLIEMRRIQADRVLLNAFAIVAAADSGVRWQRL